MHYRITLISYCFPYGTRNYIYSRHGNSKYGQSHLYGVLAPYVDRTMTEQEADDFLCEMIRRHPFVDDAMWLEIHVEWFEGNTSGFYQTLTIRNPNHSSERKQYISSPIRWR